jgi:hypothetical protein
VIHLSQRDRECWSNLDLIATLVKERIKRCQDRNQLFLDLDIYIYIYRIDINVDIGLV